MLLIAQHPLVAGLQCAWLPERHVIRTSEHSSTRVGGGASKPNLGATEHPGDDQARYTRGASMTTHSLNSVEQK